MKSERWTPRPLACGRERVPGDPHPRPAGALPVSRPRLGCRPAATRAALMSLGAKSEFSRSARTDWPLDAGSKVRDRSRGSERLAVAAGSRLVDVSRRSAPRAYAKLAEPRRAAALIGDGRDPGDGRRLDIRTGDGCGRGQSRARLSVNWQAGWDWIATQREHRVCDPSRQSDCRRRATEHALDLRDHVLVVESRAEDASNAGFRAAISMPGCAP